MSMLKDIKKLRSKTGVGIADCKEALEKAKGDFEKAEEYLRKKGVLTARKRAGKAMSNGFIGSYVHNGQIGVLVELLSETDFVSRNEKFKKLANEIALHVAAEAPLYVSVEDVPQEVVEKEKDIAREKLDTEKKPADVVEKILSGQIEKYYKEVCLLKQSYVRNQDKTIEDLVNEAVAAFGEKIEIGRFVRMELGAE